MMMDMTSAPMNGLVGMKQPDNLHDLHLICIQMFRLQDEVASLTQAVGRLSVSMETLLNNDKERKKSYSAINAQLHILQERLRSIEENNEKPLYSSLGRSNGLYNQKGADGDELSGTETIHRECLMEHLESMVRNFDLSNSYLLDELLEEECLTQDEAAVIREWPDRKDQIRKLIVHIAKRSKAKFVKFLATIGRTQFYPLIAKALKDTYEKRASEELGKECLLCAIRCDVEVKDVVDKLCKHKLVDFDFLELVMKNTSVKDQSHLWEVIFSHIDNAPNKLHAIKILQEALTVKHENLSAKLGQCNQRSFSNHQCMVRLQPFFTAIPVSNNSLRSLSSLDEMSTTSEVPEKRFNSMEETRIQIPEINSTQEEKSSNLPSTVEWVYQHSQPLSNDNDVLSTSFEPPSDHAVASMGYLQEPNRNSEACDEFRQTTEKCMNSDFFGTVQASGDNKPLNYLDENLQYSLLLAGSRPVSAETKEKRKVLRKRREKNLQGNITLDVNKVSEKVQSDSKETQTPDTTVESIGFTFPNEKTDDCEGWNDRTPITERLAGDQP